MGPGWLGSVSHQQQWAASLIEFLKNYSPSFFFFWSANWIFLTKENLVEGDYNQLCDNDLLFLQPNSISYGSVFFGESMYFSFPLYWFSILSCTQMLELDLGHHNYAIITMIIFFCH